MDNSKIKIIDLNEFTEAGYLQEANRLFFHPLGLSLFIKADDSGDGFKIGGFLDCRDDEEGIIFGPSFSPEQANARKLKAVSIQEKKDSKSAVRIKNFDWVIQPVEDIIKTDFSGNRELGH